MLTELIQLSERMEFTGSDPFVMRSIHWVIDLNREGELIGISPSVRTVIGKKGKKREERGKQFSCPTFFYMKADEKERISATAGGGNVPALLGIGRFVEFFGKEFQKEKGKAIEVVQVSGKDQKRRENFVALHQQFAAKYHENKSADAVCRFLESDTQLRPEQFIAKKGEEQNGETKQLSQKEDVDAQLVKLNDEYLTFRVAGKTISTDKDFKVWWKDQYRDQREAVLRLLPDGTDLISASSNGGKLAKVFPHISGVPNGGGYCPLASFDKEPSQSYGLGDLTAPLLIENAEKAAAALNWLLKEETTHLRLGGDLVAIFWAVDLSNPREKPKTSPFANLLADPLQVRDFLRSPSKGIQQQIDQTAFYAAILSSPQSRVTVRDWHTTTLPDADRCLREYFSAINLKGQKDADMTAYPLGLLADITIAPRKKSDQAKPQPETYIALFEAALFGAQLPHKLLTKALQRQSLELAKGTDKQGRNDFERRLAARTALIKLYFKSTKGVEMTPDKHLIENDSAYLCGRLLAMLDRIHTEAHKQSGGTNTTPANRVYGSASTTPALAFPQLCKLARHHLNKLGGGMARNLEFGVKKENRTDGINEDFEGLADIVARLLKTQKQEFPRTLRLEEQGRFAIGFYYERSLPIPRTSKPNISGNNSDNDFQTTEQEAKGDNNEQ